MNRILLIATAVLLTACSNTPKILADTTIKQTGMVVTANPYATEVGAQILRAGGSAVDAAIAIQAVLTLVEPQSSGLGGGGFMVYFDNQTKQVSIYEGRETAPDNASVGMFLGSDNEPLSFLAAKNSGLSIGVPGMVSMLQLAHSDFGTLPWSDNFTYATQLATEGFAISPRLQSFLVKFAHIIPRTVEEGTLDAAAYFYDDNGEAYPVGHRLKNQAYAESLLEIAANPGSFYSGLIANQIIEQVNTEPRPGSMTLSDLKNYKARRHDGLCVPYKELSLCGPPPPSSWLAVAMTMGLLERAPKASSAGSEDPHNWALFAQAQRLSYADRDRYVADPDKVNVPVIGMLHSDYLDERAQEISSGQAKPNITAGDPWRYEANIPPGISGKDATLDVAGTSHFVVVDLQGNVVSLTASVESIFGSTRMAGGMFLNNQLTDFSFKPVDEEGNKIANSVEPNKRPRSSMSPTIVLDENGEFKMATGSPGGNSIIAYTAKTLLGVLDWGLTPQEAVDLPNMVARGDKVRLEKGRTEAQLFEGLQSLGYEVDQSRGENSGLSVVYKSVSGELIGGVDRRREGVIEVVLP